MELAYYAYNDFLHSGVKFLENLDGSFLGDLVDAFDELFSLHSVYLTHSGEVFWSESGNAFKFKFFIRQTQRVSYGKNSWVKYSNDISCVCLIHNFPVLSQGLGKTELFASLDVVYLHACLKFSRHDPHKGNTVSVSLVHISLNLKDKCGKRLLERINHSCCGFPGKRGSGHLEEVL